MVSTATRETESNAAVTAPVVEPVAATSAAVDISAIPESPAELLKRWDAPKRSLIHIIPAAFVRIWDSLAGAGMTEQQRVRRDIAEFNGYARVRGPHV